MDFITYLSSHL